MSDPAGTLALEAVDGATVTLERFPIVVGRLIAGDQVPDVDVGHLDPGERVAPGHCRLTAAEGGVLVHDLGAPSGTWVDGARVRAGHPRQLATGGTLRVGDVQLTLVRLIPADLGAPPVIEEAADPPAARATRPAVPPPPSAVLAPASTSRPPRPPAPESRPERRPAPAAEVITVEDVTVAAVTEPVPAAPADVRRWLDTGADAVRLSAGGPALVRRRGGWAEEGPPLTVAEVEGAIALARRQIGRRDARPAGSGRGGGVLVDWVTPPLSRSPHLAAEVERREPAALGSQLRTAVARHLGHGRSLLVVSPWPAPLLAALASATDVAIRPRAVPQDADAWWVPPGWPVFAGIPESAADIDALLGGGMVIVECPPADELVRLLQRAPLGQAPIVVAVEAITVLAGLERVRGALAGGGRREAATRSATASVARALPAVLAATGPHTEMLALSAGDGDWQLSPLVPDPEP